MILEMDRRLVFLREKNNDICRVKLINELDYHFLSHIFDYDDKMDETIF